MGTACGISDAILQNRLENNIWTTIAGSPIHIMEMEDRHFCNTYRMVKKALDKNRVCAFGFGEQWMPKLHDEYVRRYI